MYGNIKNFDAQTQALIKSIELKKMANSIGVEKREFTPEELAFMNVNRVKVVKVNLTKKETLRDKINSFFK